MKTPGKLIKLILVTAVSVLALSGCTGPVGPQGPAGVSGPEGIQGPAGVSGTEGIQGPAGEQGSDGAQSSTIDLNLLSLVQKVIVRVDISKGSGFIEAFGSGIIIRSDGYVITNKHVIDSATSIMVTLSNGQRYSATVTSSDTNIDLAILKLTGSPSNLPVALLGSASDIIVGRTVIGVGFPLGRSLPGPVSFTEGIISAIRTLDGKRYIQTDVELHLGNSGSALISTDSGKVIGIIAAGVISEDQIIEGIGLAIPIDIVQSFIQNNLK